MCCREARKKQKEYSTRGTTEFNAMNERTFYKSFFAMTVTMALQNIIVFGVNLADSIMMGAYSETALSGVGICNNIQYFLMMAATGVSSGMTVIAARYWGRNDRKSIHLISAVGMWLGAAFSVIIFLFAAIAPEFLIRLYTDKPAVAEQALQYLDIIKHTYIIYALTTVLLSILRSVETVKIGFYVSLSSFAVNIVLNYIFIYGKFGAPEMGVRGAALATLIARSIELVVVVIYTLFIDKKLSFRLRDLFVTTRSMFGDYFRTGLPLMMSSVSWGVAMSIQGAIIGRLDERNSRQQHSYHDIPDSDGHLLRLEQRHLRADRQDHRRGRAYGDDKKPQPPPAADIPGYWRCLKRNTAALQDSDNRLLRRNAADHRLH